MPFSRLSIQWKITLLAGLCLLVIVSLLVATSLYQALNSTHKCNAHPCINFVRRLPAQAFSRA